VSRYDGAFKRVVTAGSMQWSKCSKFKDQGVL
jgi:hypothetical protein